MHSPNKAAFLDRDGILNREMGDYVKRLDDLEILPHVYDGLRLLQDNGYLLIVITNQGGIAKKEYTETELDQMHAFLRKNLEEAGVTLTDIYHCPHHPSVSNCLCRKPGSLLMEKAISKYAVDPSVSFMIGDKERDVLCARHCNVHGLLVEANSNWVPLVKELLEQDKLAGN